MCVMDEERGMEFSMLCDLTTRCIKMCVFVSVCLLTTILVLQVTTQLMSDIKSVGSASV